MPKRRGQDKAKGKSRQLNIYFLTKKKTKNGIQGQTE